MTEPLHKIAENANPVWHPKLGIQVPLTFETDGFDARIFAPGNMHRWELARITAGCAEQTKIYAAVMASGPDLYDAARHCLVPLEWARDHIDQMFAGKVQRNIDKINEALLRAEGK